MDYPPRMAGGTTIHSRALALALLDAGHDVHVVAARAEGAPDEEEREGVMVHRVGRPYTVWSGRRTGALLKDIDIVHGHGTCAYGHLKLHRFPTIVKMHSTWAAETTRYRELGSRPGTLMAMRTYSRMDRYCARNADHLVCITEAVARETEMAYGVPRERMTVVHNGVDVAAFRDAASLRDETRAELDLGGLTVVYVGRLEPHKGVGDLVEAAPGLGVELLILGDGSERKALEARTKELGVRATFTGFVEHDQVPRYYAAADIVCHPSLYEPLGNVVLEAMAAGRPIVAARSGGLGEVFEPGTGALVEPGDVPAMREALGRLVEEPGARRAAGEKGLETAPRYGWDKVAKATVDLGEDVLARWTD
jgi:glycosyltransferase involved in cell wall biosynthesis